jgi:hypothetical protein
LYKAAAMDSSADKKETATSYFGFSIDNSYPGAFKSSACDPLLLTTGILARCSNVRMMVPTPTPNCFAICLTLAPFRRISITFSRLNIFLGLPTGRFFPDRLWTVFPTFRPGNPAGSATGRPGFAPG